MAVFQITKLNNILVVLGLGKVTAYIGKLLFQDQFKFLTTPKLKIVPQRRHLDLNLL